MPIEILYAILIVLLPAVAYLVQCAIGPRLPRMGDWLSTGAIFASFCLASVIFFQMLGAPADSFLIQKSWTWLDIGWGDRPFRLDLGIRIDSITAIMLFMVTMCATLIHLFSTAYMRDHDGEPEDGYRYASFFSYLSLFTSAMLGLVVSDNLFTLFMFWEVMGLCSYLLIGFYRHKPSAANASIKAFMTTRIGDTGLFLGMLAIFAIVGSLRFEDIYNAIGSGAFENTAYWGAAIIGLLIFCGTVGKSAQMPLHVWLPDAMEGPTPVSSLIHAATMVAAGVYLIIRMYPLLLVGGFVLDVVAYVGAITALFAAILAIKQNDLKKVLAYSTLSQLGYMVMAVGVGALSAGFMHLITHAVFKACLFMSSGSVIWAMHHEQDMRHMGGLRKKIPITYWSMLFTTCAIAGVPWLTSGFFSKDAILAGTLVASQSGHYLLPLLGFTTAGLTAFYMFRLIFKTFHGEPHDHHHYDHAHEGGWNMWLPLVVLAVFSFGPLWDANVLGGWFSSRMTPYLMYPELASFAPLRDFFGTGMADSGFLAQEHHVHGTAMVLSIVIASAGIAFAALVFLKKSPKPESLAKIWPRFVHQAIDNLYYFDAAYIGGIIKKGLMPFSNLVANFDNKAIDRGLVDGLGGDVSMVTKDVVGIVDDVVVDGALVDGVGGAIPSSLGAGLRSLQNGKIQNYLVIAMVVIAAAFIVKQFLGVF